MTKRRLIPFGALPASWGLRGQTRAIAEAEYLYEGEELALKLAEINFPDKSSKAYRSELARIRHQYKHITDYEYEIKAVDIQHSDDFDGVNHQREILRTMLRHNRIDAYTYDIDELAVSFLGVENWAETTEFKLAMLAIDLKHKKLEQYEHDLKEAEILHPDENTLGYQLARLEVEFKHEKISQRDYDKLGATIRQEPWFDILDTKFLFKDGIGGGMTFELDWNEFHVKELVKQGHSGRDDAEIVDGWFTQVCQETFLDFQEQDLDNVLPITSANRTRRSDAGDGKGEYS